MKLLLKWKFVKNSGRLRICTRDEIDKEKDSVCYFRTQFLSVKVLRTRASRPRPNWKVISPIFFTLHLESLLFLYSMLSMLSSISKALCVSIRIDTYSISTCFTHNIYTSNWISSTSEWDENYAVEEMKPFSKYHFSIPFSSVSAGHPELELEKSFSTIFHPFFHLTRLLRARDKNVFPIKRFSFLRLQFPASTWVREICCLSKLIKFINSSSLCIFFLVQNIFLLWAEGKSKKLNENRFSFCLM